MLISSRTVCVPSTCPILRNAQRLRRDHGKRHQTQHEPPRVVGDLLQSEIAKKQARSIRYQLSIAKRPLAKDIDDFDFADTPVNESLVRELATNTFVADQRNVVLVGGTETGKSHLAIAIAHALIRNGTRGRFFDVVDLVNRPETETRNGKQVRIADYLTRLDFIILDELGYLPFAQARGSAPVPFDQQAPRAHLDHRHDEPCLRRMAVGVRRCEDDNGSPRPFNPPLRDRGNRKRILALQKLLSKLT
ncbi:hypothetical protein GGD55_003008 [Rhizobium giardinii]|uniref:AAA+ ATPase domain-containing protein n=1 Tax=Rhizobium giardinii TaxID=56731 RepID=A0A7W8X944_9HYPH|nr:hypothetical protein [Rhizobium giardinii]